MDTRTFFAFAILALFLGLPLFLAISPIFERRRRRRDIAEQTEAVKKTLPLLAECGLHLDSRFGPDMVAGCFMDDWRENPLRETLVGLSMEAFESADSDFGPPLCKNLFMLDYGYTSETETCQYTVERFSEMTDGALKFENIRIEGDDETEVLSLSFDHAGQTHELKFEKSTLPQELLLIAKMAELLKSLSTDKEFAIYEHDPFSCIVACLTTDQFNRLKEHGLEFQSVAEFLSDNRRTA